MESTTTPKDGIYLRASINARQDDAIESSSLTAFSPDIIPLGELQMPSTKITGTYEHFVAHNVDPDDSATLIYVRGKAVIKNHKSLNPLVSVLTLRAVPNELVLWPQAWEHVEPLGQSILNAKSDGQIVAGGSALRYRAMRELGRHEAFVASSAVPSGSSAKMAIDAVKNWRDLVTHVGADRSLAMWNVVFADPTARQVSMTTQFRLFEDKDKTVPMCFAIEGVAIPDGIEASLNGFGSSPTEDMFSFGRPRRPIQAGNADDLLVSVPAGFDGTITLNIYNTNAENQVFGDYSSISLVAYAVDKVDKDDEEFVLLGAEHVVFDSNARIKQLLKKRGIYNPLARAVTPSSLARVAAPGPVAHGPDFFFRCNLQDDGQVPRTGQACYSPDIQPWGPAPDANIVGDIGPTNYSVDASTKKGVGLTSGQSNYIYVRGNATAPTSGEITLFTLPNTTVIHPSQYNASGAQLTDIDRETGLAIPAIRKYNVTAADGKGPFVVDPMHPFNHVNPGPPPPGADHFCIIAECKPDGQDADGYDYDWPHNEAGAFDTAAQFTAWVLTTPYVAWRNVAYASNPNAPELIFRTGFKINPKWGVNDEFQVQVKPVNCPTGSEFSYDSSDPNVRGSRTKVTGVGSILASSLSKRPGGYEASLTASWFSNKLPIKPGQKIEVHLIHVMPSTSVLAHHARVLNANPSERIVPVSEKRIVNEFYPNLILPREGDRQVIRRKLVSGALKARYVGDEYRLRRDDDELEAFSIGADHFHCGNE